MVEYCVIGTVILTDGKKAKVKVTPDSACQESMKGCSACKGFVGNQEFIIDTDNNVGARQGEKVKVKVESPNYYKALIIVFAMPIFFLVFGYAIGKYFSRILTNAEYYFAFIGFALSFFVMKVLSREVKSAYKIINIL